MNRKACAAAFLLVLADLSRATPTVYQDVTAFESSLAAHESDTFADLPSLTLQPLVRSIGSFAYALRAESNGQADFLLSFDATSASPTDTWLSTSQAGSRIVLNNFSPGVNGFAGSFFATDFDGGVVPNASVAVTLVYGTSTTSYIIYNSTNGVFDTFRGFVDNDQLLSVTVEVNQPPATGSTQWATVAGITLGSLSPVPEPTPTALLAAGLAMLFVFLRTRLTA